MEGNRFSLLVNPSYRSLRVFPFRSGSWTCYTSYFPPQMPQKWSNMDENRAAIRYCPLLDQRRRKRLRPFKFQVLLAPRNSGFPSLPVFYIHRTAVAIRSWAPSSWDLPQGCRSRSRARGRHSVRSSRRPSRCCHSRPPSFGVSARAAPGIPDGAWSDERSPSGLQSGLCSFQS